MLGVGRNTLGALWLNLVGMKLSVEHEHWLSRILMWMGHRVVSLADVQANNHEDHGTEHMLLEWHLGLMSLLVNTLGGKEFVLSIVELLLNVTSEHIFYIFIYFFL